MPPNYAPLPRSTFRAGPEFEGTSLGQQAKQQRQAMLARQGAAPKTASFYGDTSVGTPTPNALADRIRNGSPVSNREVDQHVSNLMKPMGQDQANRLQTTSPMPGWGLAMGRADAGADQFRGQFDQAIANDKIRAANLPAFQAFNPKAGIGDRPSEAGLLAQLNQGIGTPGQHPGMLANPDRAQTAPLVGVQSAPLAFPGIQAAFPGGEAGGGVDFGNPEAGFRSVSVAPVITDADRGVAIPPPAPQPFAVAGPDPVAGPPNPNLPRDPNAHGIALNPNHSFRQPSWAGGGIGVHGLQSMAQPGVRVGPPPAPGPAGNDPEAALVAHLPLMDQVNFKMARQREQGEAAERNSKIALQDAQAGAVKDQVGSTAAALVAAGQAKTPDEGRLMAQQIHGQAPPPSPIQDPDMLINKYKGLAGAFAPPGLKPGATPNFDTLAGSIDAQQIPELSNPQSPLAQAVTAKMRQIYGPQLNEQGVLKPHPKPGFFGGMPFPVNRFTGLVNGEGFADPATEYAARERSRALYNRITGTKTK